MRTRYPFARIKEQIAARPDEVADFAIGRNPVPLPPAIAEWIGANPALAMKPATAGQIEAFNAAVAELMLREYGVALDSYRVLPTPGGRAAMSAFIACALEPGQTVYVTEPGYPAFQRLADHRHARVTTLELDPADGFAPGIGPVTHGDDGSAPRVIALNYPNNPTGAPLTSHVVEVMRQVSDENTILFNDATYGPLSYEQRPVSLLQAELAGDGAPERVELHSFSKLFPIGPVAVSFLVGSPATLNSVATYSEFAWSPLSSLQIEATTRCLRDKERLDQLRAWLPESLQALSRVLTDLGFQPFPAPTGVYVICPVPDRVGGGAVNSAADAAQRLMEQFDLAVVPWDTPHHSYLRFTSLYQSRELEYLAGLGEALQINS